MYKFLKNIKIKKKGPAHEPDSKNLHKRAILVHADFRRTYF